MADKGYMTLTFWTYIDILIANKHMFKSMLSLWQQILVASTPPVFVEGLQLKQKSFRKTNITES